MAISLRIIPLCAFLTALLFFNAIALSERTEEIRQRKSLRNSTMAERLEEFDNPHAVDDPEAIATMVNMVIFNHQVGVFHRVWYLKDRTLSSLTENGVNAWAFPQLPGI